MTVELLGPPIVEVKKNKIEAEVFDPHSIGVATSTRYSDWQPLKIGQQKRDLTDIDGIRGDLALRTLRDAAIHGFQVTVVDSIESSPAFKEQLASLENDYHHLHVHQEIQQGNEEITMSEARRQAFSRTSDLDGVAVIAWIEPEKVGMIQQLRHAAQPILNSKADIDIVIPARNEKAFESYPGYQAIYEQAANKRFNDMLKNHQLLPDRAQPLDAWFGPRLFRNKPGIRDLFMHTWEKDFSYVDKNKSAEEIQRMNHPMDPEQWPNATFLPIVAALEMYKRRGEKPKIVSVPITYHHPDIQKASETARASTGSETFHTKRQQQFNSILGATAALIQVFEYDRGVLFRKEGPALHGGKMLYSKKGR